MYVRARMSISHCKVTGRFDEELVANLPSTLRFITSNGAGYDQSRQPLKL